MKRRSQRGDSGLETSTTDWEWRKEFLKLCGPGVLAGITLGMWLTLLRERGRAMEWKRCLRAASITNQSLQNSFWARVERLRFDAKVRDVSIQPPVFILGHWRSGTTHLHELLAQDPRFGYPNSYQVSFPHTFLSTQQFVSRVLSFFVPKHRPMDQMEMTLDRPQEDEFALCCSTLKSPCMGWVFPRQRQDFEKYLTLSKISAEELAQWQDAFVWFLKKVQFRCPRPLMLKSPPHTARIRLLLQMFPEAKFVHIHRDPYRVIQSSLHTFEILYRWHGLQTPNPGELEDYTIGQYKAMYEDFFREKAAVPGKQFYEIAYESLEQDPIGELGRLYQALNLPHFAIAEPVVRRYLSSIADYRKNRLPDMSEQLRLRIGRDCRQSFEKWGYPV